MTAIAISPTAWSTSPEVVATWWDAAETAVAALRTSPSKR